MKPRILVIGGSYFAGRVFTMVAADRCELTLLNRGRYSMSRYPGVQEVRCDRHDTAALSALPPADYDAVVDFCAYAPGDVETLCGALKSSFKKYIYISTADVYDRAAPQPWTEQTPVGTDFSFAGPDTGAYLAGKAALERECAAVCAAKGADCVILRPAFLYGPYNYAPREPWYIRTAVSGQPIPQPTDADGRFQFVYVKDLAMAVLACLGPDAPAGARAYNLAAPEVLDYAGFLATLQSVADRPIPTTPVTVEQVLRENLPLPFPLRAAESELFDGSLAERELGLHYTPFRDGMEKAWNAFAPIFAEMNK
ncbi:MAG: NAD-dependent epimerase/dehydratase family protein [Ruminococcaceae bacterium]|nr:NAD-dependent epimerase/dehydratase family protein [Oscillospiraceae bacterium]